jgi:hypothetical protein
MPINEEAIEIYSQIHNRWFRTQDVIDEEMDNLMKVVVELNKKQCDNCDLNKCRACVGE